MALSVIIPVYNAAPYLETCVSSLRALSSLIGIGMEIIMVDDGSTLVGIGILVRDLCIA